MSVPTCDHKKSMCPECVFRDLFKIPEGKTRSKDPCTNPTAENFIDSKYCSSCQWHFLFHDLQKPEPV